MGVTTIIAPQLEPVTLAEARAHVRATTTEEDAFILRLIRGARQRAETFTRRAFITQTLDWVMDAFPCEAVMELPRAPLQSITSVSYVDTAGVTQTLSPSLYQVDIISDPGRMARAYGQVWPSTRCDTLNAVTVRYVAGYGLAAAVPDEIKWAMLLIIGHGFENREEVAEKEFYVLPNAADALLTPYRVLRF